MPSAAGLSTLSEWLTGQDSARSFPYFQAPGRGMSVQSHSRMAQLPISLKFHLGHDERCVRLNQKRLGLIWSELGYKATHWDGSSIGGAQNERLTDSGRSPFRQANAIRPRRTNSVVLPTCRNIFPANVNSDILQGSPALAVEEVTTLTE